MSKAGKRLLDAAREAVAIARGEKHPMTFDLERQDLIAIIGNQAAEIVRLRAVLNRLLLNYSAALPEGQKDQRSIAEARKLLGLDDQ